MKNSPIPTLGFHGTLRGDANYQGRHGIAAFTVQAKQPDGSYVVIAKCHDADDGKAFARRETKRVGGEYAVIKGRKVFFLTSDDAKRAR
jgi:hypothetical protein